MDENGAITKLFLAFKNGDLKAKDEALNWIVDINRWDSLETSSIEQVCKIIEQGRSNLKYTGLKIYTQPYGTSILSHKVACFDFDDDKSKYQLVLIPGGEITLGLPESIRETLQRVMPADAYDYFNEQEAIDQFEKEQEEGLCFAKEQRVHLSPFLVEVNSTSFMKFIEMYPEPPDLEYGWVETDFLKKACSNIWQLPSPSQFEHLYAAGSRKVFPWGDALPQTDECPVNIEDWTNAYGVRFTAKSDMECTSRYGWFKGFEKSAWDSNGYDGRIVWMCSYMTHKAITEDSSWEFYQNNYVRRILPIVEKPQVNRVWEEEEDILLMKDSQ